MQKLWRLLFCILLLTGAGCSSSSPSGGHISASLPLGAVRDVRLPGRTTRFDYQSIDPVARRLYIAHLGDSSVVVVNLERLRPVATIGDVSEVHGVLAVPELNRVFATATGTNELVAIDMTTNRIAGRAPTGEFPDGLAYDQVDGLVLVSNKNAGTESVIDGRTLRSVATIKFGDEVGNVEYDQVSKLAWVAARTPDQLVAFDPMTHRVVHRIRLPGCEGAHGVYLSPDGRAFVACERNARLAVVDLTRRRLVELVDVGADPDVLAVDPTDARLYVAAESGVVTVLATQPHLRVLGRAHLADTAHTVAVDPGTRRVFVPLEDRGGHPVLRIMTPSR